MKLETLNKLTKTVEDLKKRHKIEIDRIISKTVLDNAEYKVGDIVSDSSKSIEVTKVKWSESGFWESRLNPQAVYFGYILTKKLVRRKDLKTAHIYENDINNEF